MASIKDLIEMEREEIIEEYGSIRGKDSREYMQKMLRIAESTGNQKQSKVFSSLIEENIFG